MSLFSSLGMTNDYRASSPGLEDQDARKQRFLDAIKQTQGRTEASSPFLQAQTGLMGQLQQTAAGQGPSIAGAMLNQAQNQNVQTQMAQAASARGAVNPALLQRNAMMAGAQSAQSTAQQAAIARMQEAQAAQQSLAGISTQGRAQDQSFQAQKDQTALGYNNLDLGAAQANLNANMQAQQVNAGITGQNAQNSSNFVGGLISGGAAAGAAFAGGGGAKSPAAASDENLKKNVKDGNGSMYSFLDALKAHSYNYKDPKSDGAGKHFSVMAQELEKTPVGKSMVEETPRGKMVDYGKGFGALLAAQAELHERLKSLEGKRK